MKPFFTIVLSLALASQACAQTAVGRFYIGVDGGPGQPSANDASVLTRLDSSGDRAAMIVSVPESGTISKVLLWLGNTATGGDIVVALKTVGTDGLPTSTDYGGSASVSPTIGGTDDNKAVECTLGTPATAVAGDLVAVVVTYSSGDIEIGVMGSATSGSTPPICLTDTTGSWALSNKIPKAALYYSGSSSYKIPLNCFPPGKVGTINITQNATPDEVGFQFTAPVDMRLCGVSFSAREFGSTAEINVDVLSNAATPLSLLTNRTVFTHDTIKNINGFSNVSVEPESLAAAQVVNVTLFSEDTSNNLTVRYYQVDNAAHWGDYAQGLAYISRTRTDNTANGGPGFTADTTKRLLGGLWFDQITTSGGGSNVVDPLSGTVPGL